MCYTSKMLAEPWWRRNWRWLLLAAIFVLRLPGFFYGILDHDETEFLIMARGLLDGRIPFVDLVENKPFLSYAFYLPSALVGFEIWPAQVLAVLWVFATCWVVERTTTLWTGDRNTGLVAACICGMASSCNVLSVNAELMLNLPVAASLWCFVRSQKTGTLAPLFFAGVAVGLAALFKQQGGITLLGLWLGVAFVYRHRLRRAFAGTLLLGLGFSAPWLLLAGVYAALGHWGAFYEWNVERNLLYASKAHGSVLARFAIGLGYYIVFAVPLPWYFAVRETFTRRADPVRFGLLCVLWATWVAVALGGRFYAHYYLQFVPALALVAAPGAARLWRGWHDLRRALRVWVVVGLLVPTFGYMAYAVIRGAVGAYPSQDRATLELARWFREQTAPEARIFLWGQFSPIFYFAERMPGTRYKNVATHIGDLDPGHVGEGFDFRPYVSRRDVRNTLQDFAAREPEYFVDTSPCNIHGWSRFSLSLLPELDRIRSERYELVASPARCLVYRRRPNLPPLQAGAVDSPQPI